MNADTRHTLLVRQLKRYNPTPVAGSDEEFNRFLQAVSDAYYQMDDDRDLLERSLELTSSELNTRNQALQRSNDELAKFAYVVSHDLQEPLRSIAGYVQLFARRFKDKVDVEGQQFLDGAVGGVRRMQNFISELLEYSRAGQKLRRNEVNLNEIVASVQEDLRTAIREARAIIEVAPLPVVIGDPRALSQIFLNVLSNAIKFRVPDQAPHIAITCEERANDYAICFRDNGIGIPKGQATRIFEMFQSAHSRTEYSGSGMGLAICAKLATHMGGSMWADEGDQGASFWLEMKRHEPDTGQQEP